MDPMDNIGVEYQNSSETRISLQNEEFINSNYAMDEVLSGSSSSDGAASSAASKNMVSERNPRKMLNNRLLALRSVVPKSSKMDETSLINDAIDYVQELHEQQTRIEAEIVELETGKVVKKKKKNLNDNNNNNSGGLKYDQEELRPAVLRPKKKTIEQVHDSVGSRITPIEVHELRVAYMGQKTVLVSLTCSQKTDTMVRLCQVFESLKLKVITANITAVSGRLLKTVFVEADEDEKDDLKMKIETAIAALNDPRSP